MNQEDWAKLQPDDIINSFVSKNRVLPVRLIVMDHNGRWIGYRLNNRRDPVEAIVLQERPAIWQKALD